VVDPSGIVWIIGIIIGIELVFCGVTFIMMSSAVKRLPTIDE
jgi:uncharacterized membrane protein HdeD (DUF308 family)